MTPTETPAKQSVNLIISRLRAKQRRVIEKLKEEIEAAPRTIRCNCGAPEAILNVEKSAELGHLVYDCEKCLELERDLEWNRRQSAAGIPVDVRHAHFGNWSPGDPAPASDHPSKVLEAARALSNGEIRNLILAGPPGVGKGHLTAAIANKMLWEQGPATKLVLWRICHRLFEASHKAYEDRNRDALISQHVNPRLLVLDEAAMAEMPKDGERFLYDIIERRHTLKQRTVILSNQGAAQIRNWLGPAITDRLRSGGVKFQWLEWPSARGNRQKDGAF